MDIDYELRRELPYLGFDPGKDRIVGAVHSELGLYTRNPDLAMTLWKWDPKALTAEDHYKIDQLLRMFVFQRDQVLAALSRLDEEYFDYVDSDPAIAAQDREFRGFLPLETSRALAAWIAANPQSAAKPQERLSRDWLPETWENDALVTTPPWLGKPGMTEEERQAIGKRVADAMMRGGQRGDAAYVVSGVISYAHPVVASNLGSVPSLAMGGPAFAGSFWRFKDNGYPREWIADGRLYDLIDMALALQAELQLQCLLTDREFTRVIQTRGQEFEYLKAEAARKAAEEQGGSFWAVFGDILGIVSAVAGVLALIPVLTPIAGPVAAVTAIAALGAHTVDAAIKGDWDAATIVGLGADALAALPGVGAVAKSLKAGKAVVKTIGTGAKASYKASVGVRRAGLTFLAETGGSGASDATKVFNYIGTKGAKVVGASEKAGKLAGKVLQGSVNLSTQVPLVVEMSTGTDMSQAKEGASGAALTANYGQSIGSWGIVGDAAKKTGTVSLATFSKIIGRR
ncbi:hypothetical protein ACFVX9_18320 [Kitasatospora sp. NPDC058243]|uniref:hypothetical protein n=1 Tax=Kitasatospora sp. NPDC058243 TaxID=3346397 RepID=UPI0036DA3CA3